MEINFNVTMETRKPLVAAVSEVTGVKAEYQRAPSYAYAVGSYIIDRNGTLVFDERTDAEDVRVLLAGLTERGFIFEGNIDEIVPVVSEQADAAPDDLTKREVISDGGILTSVLNEGETDMTPRNGESSAEEPDSEVSVVETPDRLVIEVPLTGFTLTALDNLDKLIAGKAALIMKAIGADALPVERTEETLRFPWFALPASKDAIDAYSRFVLALCGMAKKQKRVTLRESGSDSDSSEKFAFRCFLLRLGFIGKEYANARKVLLSKLSGNGSFKSGDHKRGAAPEGATAADSGGEKAEAVTVREDDSSADNAPTGSEAAVVPSKCGECLHHCYYTEGLLCTSIGDIVDTSKRTPDKYTHYCLGAPSGFRKIKNASDWSGFEAPTSWCPLHTMSNNSAATGGEEAADE